MRISTRSGNSRTVVSSVFSALYAGNTTAIRLLLIIQYFLDISLIDCLNHTRKRRLPLERLRGDSRPWLSKPSAARQLRASRATLDSRRNEKKPGREASRAHE